ncbi:hypothetical protein [uncultured Algibacter sp.]|uniref:hypothetical protein n=1 Tax=uncultured Algibacter sp. TaxID=298659 RepID=UPI0026370A41|nr:hypothetical protein [uncultured Algibacter sp.]
MSSHKLSFGTINILKNNLAEVIVDEGVVMDEVMIDEYHDFLLNTLDVPFALLVNKKNSYTYTFTAQKNIVHLNEIKAIAVITKTSGAVMSTETLINVNGNINSNIKLFQERQSGLTWLNDQLS